MTTLTFPGAGSAGPEEESLTIVDPRDGREVGTIETTTREAAETAVLRAKDAQLEWARTPSAARGACLHRAAALLEDHAEELAALNARETGRVPDDALAGVRAGIATLRQYAELGPVHRGHSLLGNYDASDYTRTEPRGLAVALTPWNDPIAVACGLVGAALVTGNTVVHKPSERCPHLGARLGEIISDAFPAGVFQTLIGGSAVGSMLVADPLVDVVAHVGSTAAGRAIGRLATLSGAHAILENGGNDAIIVDAGVDPEWAAAQVALGAFANAGQVCTSVERVYVHRSVADAVLSGLVREAERLNASGELGPLVDDRLREHVDAQVRAAIDDGAELLTGGVKSDGPGSYYPATVLSDCTSDMDIMREETFGPVAPVRIVDSFAEGLALADDDRYGLSATVLTPSIEQAELAISRLQVGTVKINSVFGGAPGGSATPRRESGQGFGYGPELLDEFTVTKVVHLTAPGTVASGGGR